MNIYGNNYEMTQVLETWRSISQTKITLHAYSAESEGLSG